MTFGKFLYRGVDLTKIYLVFFFGSIPTLAGHPRPGHHFYFSILNSSVDDFEFIRHTLQNEKNSRRFSQCPNRFKKKIKNVKGVNSNSSQKRSSSFLFKLITNTYTSIITKMYSCKENSTIFFRTKPDLWNVDTFSCTLRSSNSIESLADSNAVSFLRNTTSNFKN